MNQQPLSNENENQLLKSCPWSINIAISVMLHVVGFQFLSIISITPTPKSTPILIEVIPSTPSLQATLTRSKSPAISQEQILEILKARNELQPAPTPRESRPSQTPSSTPIPTSQPAPTPSLQPTSQLAPTPRESRPSQTPSSTPIPSSQPAPTPSLQPTSQPAPTPSLQPTSQPAPTPRESRPSQTPSSTPIPTSQPAPTPSLQPSSQLAPTPRESRPPQTPSSTPIPTSKSTPTDEDCENYKDCGDYEDYSRLEELLQDNEWQKANEETSKILLKYSNKKTHLDTGAYSEARIPQDVYLEIDRLWREYSRGHFGMSVQNSIWKEVRNSFIKQSKNCSGSDEKIVDECFKKFAKRVGHLDQNGNYLQIDSLKYHITLAPKGHLPVIGLPSTRTYNLARRIKNQLYLDEIYR